MRNDIFKFVQINMKHLLYDKWTFMRKLGQALPLWDGPTVASQMYTISAKDVDITMIDTNAKLLCLLKSFKLLP